VDDEEWGWGGEGSSHKGGISSVEMTPSGHRTTLHHRSNSPGSGGHSNAGVDTTAKDRTATLQHRGSFGQGSSGTVDNGKPRGLSVKKIGMKNPLHAAAPTVVVAAATPVRKIVAPPPLTRPMATATKQQIPDNNPVVKKLQAPKDDDFFEQMGFNAKPTFKPSSIPAVVPPPPSSGNADWGDDGDLDDLLDD
jgi:hypothetical protein